MKRRDFLRLFGGATAGWPIATRAQNSGRVARIGMLIGFREGDPEAKRRLEALLQRMRELGWVEGENVRIDLRWTPDANLMTAFAEELVALHPDLLLGTSSYRAVIALQSKTDAIPILFVNTTDPVGSGLIPSLSRPTGNLTGFTNFEYTIGGKWLDILKRIAPSVKRVAMLFNPDTAPHALSYLPWFEAASNSNGLESKSINVRNTTELTEAISSFAQAPDGGLIVANDIFIVANRRNVIALAAELNLPAIYPFRFFAADGGLISYGSDATDIHRRAASYVDRILRGDKIRDLPVQQPTKFETIINLKTAKAMGLDVPANVLAFADEVIE
jgi:putative tryptophan/tyrosine transport system substrate-binding protein